MGEHIQFFARIRDGAARENEEMDVPAFRHFVSEITTDLYTKGTSREIIAPEDVQETIELFRKASRTGLINSIEAMFKAIVAKEIEKALFLAFCAGYHYAQAYPDGDKIVTDDLTARMKAATNINKAHEKRRDTINHAVAYAEKLWTEGNRLQHHEMTDYLLTLLEYKHLPKTSLRKALVPIAAKFGKARGISK